MDHYVQMSDRFVEPEGNSAPIAGGLTQKINIKVCPIAYGLFVQMCVDLCRR